MHWPCTSMRPLNKPNSLHPTHSWQTIMLLQTQLELPYAYIVLLHCASVTRLKQRPASSKEAAEHCTQNLTQCWRVEHGPSSWQRREWPTGETHSARWDLQTSAIKTPGSPLSSSTMWPKHQIVATSKADAYHYIKTNTNYWLILLS